MKDIALLILILFLTEGVQSQENQEERNLATFRQYWKEIVNTGDFSKHHVLVSPEFRVYFPEDPPQIEAKGIDLIKKAKQRRDRSFSQIELVEDEVIANGNTVIIRFHVVAMHDKMPVLGIEPNGEEITWHGTGFYRFNEKGLISEARLLTNRTAVFTKLAEQSPNKIDIEKRNLATFHRYWKELVNGGDFSNHHQIISPDFTIYNGGRKNKAKGVNLLRESERNRYNKFSKVDLILDQVTIDENVVTARWQVFAVHDIGAILDHEPDGNTLTWHSTGFYKFDKNGLITEARIVGNMFEILKFRDLSRTSENVEVRNLATFQRYWKEIVNCEDFSKHYEIISPDFTISIPGVSPDHELKGIDIFIHQKEMNDKAYSKIAIIEDDIIVKGNRIATQWHGAAIHDKGPVQGFEVIPDDKEIVWNGTAFYIFNEKGLITEARLLTNFNEVMITRADRAAKKSNVE